MRNPFKNPNWKTIASCPVDVTLSNAFSSKVVEGVVVIQQDDNGNRRARVKSISSDKGIDYDYAVNFLKTQGVNIP